MYFSKFTVHTQSGQHSHHSVRSSKQCDEKPVSGTQATTSQRAGHKKEQMYLGRPRFSIPVFLVSFNQLEMLPFRPFSQN